MTQNKEKLGCVCCGGEMSQDKKATMTKQEFDKKLHRQIIKLIQECDWYRSNNCDKIHEELVVKRSAYATARELLEKSKSKVEFKKAILHEKMNSDGHSQKLLERGLVRLAELRYMEYDVFYSLELCAFWELAEFNESVVIDKT